MTTNYTKYIILGDSRAKQFDSILHNFKLNFQLQVIAYSGATILSGTRRFLQYDQTQCDSIILALGVNDLTRLEYTYDGSRRLVRPRFDNLPDLVDTLTDKYTKAKQLLSAAGYRCIICELTGMDLNKYNKHLTSYHDFQLTIDEAVPVLNRVISAINYDDKLPTPYLQDSIHHKCRKTDTRRRTKYAKLRDGLHPHDETARCWLKQIIKSIIKL